MKMPRVTVRSEEGALVFSGSLHHFARANEMDSVDVAALNALLAVGEPAVIGGGAAPAFLVEVRT